MADSEYQALFDEEEAATSDIDDTSVSSGTMSEGEMLVDFNLDLSTELTAVRTAEVAAVAGENEAITEEENSNMRQLIIMDFFDDDVVEQQIGTDELVPANETDDEEQEHYVHQEQLEPTTATSTTASEPPSHSCSCATASNTAAGHVMCSICQDAIHFNNINHAPLAVAMLCGHMYHEKCLTNWVDTGKETCPTCRTTCQKRLIQRVYPEWCPNSVLPTVCPLANTELTATSAHEDDQHNVERITHSSQAERATELLTSRMLSALRLTLAERDQLRTLGAALTDIVSNRLGDMEQSLDRLFHDTEQVGGVMRDQHERLCRLFNQMRAERNEYRTQAAQMGDAYVKSRQLCCELLTMAKQLKAGQIEPTHALNQRLFTLCQAQNEQLQLMQLGNDCQKQHFALQKVDLVVESPRRSTSPVPISRENIVAIMQRYGFSTESDVVDNAYDSVQECEAENTTEAKYGNRAHSITYIDELLTDDDNDVSTSDRFQDEQLERLYADYLNDYNNIDLSPHKLSRPTRRMPVKTNNMASVPNKKIEQLRSYVNKIRLKNLNLENMLQADSFPSYRESQFSRKSTADASILSSTNSTCSLASSVFSEVGGVSRKLPVKISSTIKFAGNSRASFLSSASFSADTFDEEVDADKVQRSFARPAAGRLLNSRAINDKDEPEERDMIYDRIIARAQRLEAIELAEDDN